MAALRIGSACEPASFPNNVRVDDGGRCTAVQKNERSHVWVQTHIVQIQHKDTDGERMWMRPRKRKSKRKRKGKRGSSSKASVEGLMVAGGGGGTERVG